MSPRELRYQPHDLEPIDALAELHAKCLIEAEEYASRPKPEPIRTRGEPVDIEAVTEIVSPYYIEGQRHDVSLYLAGYLARQGVAQDDAEAVVRAIARGDDDEGEQSVERVRYTYTAAAEGTDVRGYTGLVEILSEAALRELAALVEPSRNGKHDAELEPPMLPRLPAEFYQTRSSLEHIRRAAHARLRSADAVFHCVLARIAAFRPPAAEIDTGIGSPASLNYQAALVDPSGGGKSSPEKIARRALPAPVEYEETDGLPLGTGEGLAESYMGTVERLRGDGKPVSEREQTRWNVLYYADEGQVLTRIAERSGSTLSESLRRAFNGETLGQTNASRDRTRRVRDYSLGLIIGIQPATALALLDDAATGTPQRFVWCSTVDPSIPDDPPAWPGPLSIDLVRHRSITIDPDICAELRRDDLARQRGQLRRDPLDAHEPLCKLKIAGLLALLDGRHHVEREDWRLAGTVWETSCAVRNMLVDYGHALRRARAKQETREHVGRTLAADRARDRDQAAVERVAGVIARKAQRTTGTLAKRDLRDATASRDRKYLDRAIAHAVRIRWIAEREDGRYEPRPVEP